MNPVRLTTPFFVFVALGCSDKDKVLPFHSEASVSDSQFFLSAFEVNYKSAREYPGCKERCKKFDGHFDVTIETSRTFDAIPEPSVRVGPSVTIFDVPCATLPVTEDSSSTLRFICPTGGVRDVKPDPEAVILFYPDIPSWQPFEEPRIVFPGRYDPATFPRQTD